jgi:hypothetical protein
LLTSDLQRQYPNIKQVLADLVGQQQAEWRARAKAEGQEIAPPDAYIVRPALNSWVISRVMISSVIWQISHMMLSLGATV